MALRINRRDAEGVFEDALSRIRSGEPIPEDWLSNFERLAEEHTYTAVLATALLARAVTPRADARVLHANAGPDGYSARGLFSKVIFELCQVHNIPLGSIGREPHNNSPFYHTDRIDASMRNRVHASNLQMYDLLVNCLDIANTLNQQEAALAFSAFLKLSLRAASTMRLELIERDYDLAAARAWFRSFVTTGGEGSRRGEAIVAAALDLIFENVRVNVRPNDPSRHWPGDVIALAPDADMRTRDPRHVLLATEVKERQASPGEVLQFSQNVAKAGVRRAAYAALHESSAELDPFDLEEQAWNRHQVSMHIFRGIDSLVSSVFTFTTLSVPEAITAFLHAVTKRLEEKQATGGIAEWALFLEQLAPDANVQLTADADVKVVTGPEPKTPTDENVQTSLPFSEG